MHAQVLHDDLREAHRPASGSRLRWTDLQFTGRQLDGGLANPQHPIDQIDMSSLQRCQLAAADAATRIKARNVGCIASASS